MPHAFLYYRNLFAGARARLFVVTFIQNFNPETQFVDVAGSFNNWDGINYVLEPIGNNIYTIIISNVEAGDELEFKFRIDGDWNNAEFPGYGGNRQYSVIQ